MINVESHGFSCHLGIIAFAIGKIALASLVQLAYLLLMQLFPNRTQIHVITHTNLSLCSTAVMAAHQSLHGDGVKDVAFSVEDCRSLYKVWPRAILAFHEFCSIRFADVV